MSRIRGRHTKPELQIRQGMHSMGFRYRLHARELPGKPDLVFPKYRAVIFVNGCFWHGHMCPLFVWPKTRTAFWKAKIQETVRRDKANYLALHSAGWTTLTVWECALRGPGRIPLMRVLGECATWLLTPHRTNIDILSIEEGDVIGRILAHLVGEPAPADDFDPSPPGRGLLPGAVPI
jgi:DNA mismatch endonuclease (patch repair protein)